MCVMDILIDCVQLWYTYVDKQFEMTQSVGVCVNILIDIGRQTV